MLQSKTTNDLSSDVKRKGSRPVPFVGKVLVLLFGISLIGVVGIALNHITKGITSSTISINPDNDLTMSLNRALEKLNSLDLLQATDDSVTISCSHESDGWLFIFRFSNAPDDLLTVFVPKVGEVNLGR